MDDFEAKISRYLEAIDADRAAALALLEQDDERLRAHWLERLRNGTDADWQAFRDHLTTVLALYAIARRQIEE